MSNYLIQLIRNNLNSEKRRQTSPFRVIRKIYQFFYDRPIKAGIVLNEHYKVIRVIGMGSYGIVYLCKDIGSKKKIVVKQLRPSKRRNKKEIELFKNEIYVLRMLNHQNIPVLCDTFSSNGHLFYVMSFIEGDNIEDEIFYHKKSFNEKEALGILAQLLELVDYLHNKDIYHQDLRIPNLLLKNKELFLIDFGLAKHGVVKERSSSSTQNQDWIQEMKLQDYYDLGEILLYLLYTTYTSKNKKALPWTEELSLEKDTVHLLKRLLQINEPYANTSEIAADLQAAMKVIDQD
jgi:serine/threonine protein kinase, bacterial